MLALERNNWEPCRVGAVVVDEVLGMNPHELMALVQAQFGHYGLVPPVLAPLGQAAAAALCVLLCSRGVRRALARVDVEPCVRGDEGRVGPVGLDTSSLCGPVVSVPDGAVDAHRLVFGEGNAFRLFVRVHSDWSLVHKETDSGK